MNLIRSIVCLLYFCSRYQAIGYKILGLCSAIPHSHFTLSFRLMKELADRGHEVTFFNNHPQEVPIKNLKDVSVRGIDEATKEFYATVHKTSELSYFGQLKWVLRLAKAHTKAFLTHKNVQELMRSDEHFDLVIVHHFFNDALVAFAHKFNAPLVIISPWEVNYFNNYFVGNPVPVSYIYHSVAEYGAQMTFRQRLENAFNQILSELFINRFMIPELNVILKETFPKAPDLEKVIYNTSLLLSASHLALTQPLALQPNVKYIGGYHILPPKPLPKDIQEFMDNSTEGVILFSMGSVLRSAKFDHQTKKHILTALSKLKQKVLWKFEEDLPEKPSNVKILKWLPQSDVLAHPNTVAFISHGGLLSTTEAVYHRVPILGIPVFWDQLKNIATGVNKGFALRVSLSDLDEKSFSAALNELINNPKYKIRAKEMSLAMRDQPLKSLDEAVFWIEHVIRHKGAKHLRSEGMNLKWYQYYSLDVILFCFALVFLIPGYICCLRKRKKIAAEFLKKNN